MKHPHVFCCFRVKINPKKELTLCLISNITNFVCNTVNIKSGRGGCLIRLCSVGCSRGWSWRKQQTMNVTRC